MAADKKLFVNAGGKKLFIGNAVFVHLDLRKICTAGERGSGYGFYIVGKRDLLKRGTVFESVRCKCLYGVGNVDLIQRRSTVECIGIDDTGSVSENDFFNGFVVTENGGKSLDC